MTSEQIRQVQLPVLAIWRDADRDRQDRELLFGEQFAQHRVVGDMAYGTSVKDGYPGFVELAGLGATEAATHIVRCRASHLYPAHDMKTPPLFGLSFGSRLTIKRTVGKFSETSQGDFVPADHVQPVDQFMDDPASVAEKFLGTPYLWGGNSCWGVDCSGLVQAALNACRIDCPADSGQQREAVGTALGDNAPAMRGDLLFWKDHVAMALDGRRLIQSTAFHMAVVIEDIDVVISRNADLGYGPVLARRRP